MSAANLPASRRLVWSVILSDEKLKETERQLIPKLKDLPAFDQLYELGQQFVAMVRERDSAALKSWLERAQTSQLTELANFATGLKREEASIEAALKYTYSNGVAEGHVNRLKMIKRTMYGRASFELLRKRVLAA
jgi:transposase